MSKENKITVNNLIYALLFFVFGMILLTSTEDLISKKPPKTVESMIMQ